MAPNNLFKRDDILIRTGGVLLLVMFVVLVGSVHDTTSFVWAMFFSLAPIALLATGAYYRHKERRILAIWRILDRATFVRVNDLVQSAGFQRQEILSALHIINSSHQAYFVHDPHTDSIVDGRLRQPMPVRSVCVTCGAPWNGNEQGQADWVQTPTCQHCGTEVTNPDWKALRTKVMADLKAPGAVTIVPPETLNVQLFILLAVFCWPAAIIYYINKHRPR